MQRKKTPKPPATIAALGERGLIERLDGLLPQEPRWVAIGRGDDDCAALDLGAETWTLVTCDAQVEGTHFRREWIDARTLGRRAASVNLSDIAAMGGEPLAAVASLLVPRSLDVRVYDDVMRGLGERLAEFGAALVGGNLSRARRLAIDVTLLGRVHPSRCVRRAGARPGDHILVTGAPGESRAGLMQLRAAASSRGARARSAASGKPPARGSASRRARGRDPLVRRFLDPEPRLLAARLLARGGARAMLDVSDGLATDLAHLCAASGVGARVDQERLPVSRRLQRFADARGVPAWRLVLQGGEDYELLCAVPPRRVRTLQAVLRQRANLVLTDIGTIEPADSGLRLVANGRSRTLAAAGFEHFG